MEEKFDKEAWRRENIKEKSGMTFEQLKDNYNYHHDKLIDLYDAYNFMQGNLYGFFEDAKADGFIMLLQAAKYLAECIELECVAFGWLANTLRGKWDTDNYELDHEIYNLYDLSCAQKSEAKELLESIDDLCGEACSCYMTNYAKFTDDEMHSAMQKILDCSNYPFEAPEKPKYNAASYPRKYFGHEEK